MREACGTWLACLELQLVLHLVLQLVLQLVVGTPEPKLIRLVGVMLEPKFLTNCLEKQNQHFCQRFSS